MNEHNINALVELIRTNKGFTATHTGVALRLSIGYMVSLEGYEVQVKLGDTDKIRLAIKQYGVLAKAQQKYIGAWVHQGLLYLDLSERYFTASEALKQAKKNNQLAVFNNRTKEVESV